MFLFGTVANRNDFLFYELQTAAQTDAILVDCTAAALQRPRVIGFPRPLDPLVKNRTSRDPLVQSFEFLERVDRRVGLGRPKSDFVTENCSRQRDTPFRFPVPSSVTHHHASHTLALLFRATGYCSSEWNSIAIRLQCIFALLSVAVLYHLFYL